MLDHLCKHRDGQKPENRPGLEAAERVLPKTMLRLEALKPRITRRYEAHQKLLLEREARRSASTRGRADGRPPADDRDTSVPRRPSAQLDDVARPLAAAENRHLAVEIAHTEIRRRETARKATRQAGISAAEEHERRTAGLWGDWEQALARDGGATDDLQRRLQDTRRRMDEPGRRASRAPNRRSAVAQSDYSYPSVPRRADSPSLEPASLAKPGGGVVGEYPPPDVPPKPRTSSVASDALPPRPEKDTSPVAGPTTTGPPSAGFSFKPSAYLENGTPLRTIFLPPGLRGRFLELARANTAANLETCGVLCGTLISNALFVSRLVVPDQRSTSDTCETVNEDALFAYCDAEDLMVLGWIHTHPTQTCFMSSRDLHTHAGYQVMMPESIAIVCAPTQSPVVRRFLSCTRGAHADGVLYRWGVFRLTDPPGIKAVLDCRKPGLFHPHDETHLYTDALRPGHVFEAAGLDFAVVDLRPAS